MGIDYYLMCNKCEKCTYIFKNYSTPGRIESQIGNIAHFFDLHTLNCNGDMHIVDSDCKWNENLKEVSADEMEIKEG